MSGPLKILRIPITRYLRSFANIKSTTFFRFLLTVYLNNLNRSLVFILFEHLKISLFLHIVICAQVTDQHPAEPWKIA